MASGTIWIPVAPSFKGFGAALVKEATGASQQAANRLDSDMSRAGQRAGQKAGQGMSQGVKAGAAEIEKATRQVVTARKRESDAAANVTLAEARLADARAKGANAQTIARNEQALESARRKQASASGQLEAAESDLEAVRKGEPGRAQAVIRASGQLETARLRVADANDKVKLAEQELERVQSKSDATATQVANAQAKLQRAKSEQASATDILRGKEALHEATLEDVERQAKSTGDAVEDAGKKSDRSGGLMSKAADGAKKLAIGLGAAAATGIGVALTKGMSRINQIDEATAKLTGLGHSAQEVETIMNAATASVKGTAFGLGDAATVAASTVAAGIEPGKDLERTLRLTADAATIAGRDMADMGSIINKVATADMMQMDVANQLMDAGIPILQMVADEMGVTAEEARKLASDGKVSFETFQNALEAGLGGAALESGNTLRGSLANLGAAMGRLGEAALKPFIQDGKDLIGTLTEWVNTITERVGPAIEGFADYMVNTVIPAVKDAADWIKRNRDWLEPLAVAVGAAAAAWGVWVGAIKAWQTVTKIATGIQAAFNAVMAVNPIMLVVMAVAALVAGLVWFFAQTETGKAVWESFTNAISTGWEWVKEAFASAWAVIQPILSGIWEAIKIVGGVVAAVVLGVILVYWNLMSAYLSFVWESIIKPVFAAIQWALQELGDFFGWVWSALIKPAWDALGFGIAWVWNVLIRPTWDALKIALGAVGSFFQWVWSAIIKPAWDALGAGISWVWQNVIRPAWDALKAALGAVGAFFQRTWNSVIKPVWEALGNGIRAVIDSVIKPAWDGLKSALESVGSFFSTIVDGIRQTWDKTRSHVAKPVNFVIETVWNNGLVRAWNTIAGFLPGLPEASTLAPVAFAEGGKVPFVSGAKRGEDSVNAILMPDEHVLDVNDVRSFGGHGNVYAMRQYLDQGRPFMFDGSGGIAGLPRNPDHRAGDLAGAAPDLLLPRFADGGAVRRQIRQDDNVRPAWMDQLAKGHEFASRIAPGPYVLGGSTGGVPGGPSDCSGFLSEIADVILGGPGGTRQWATGSFPGPQAGAWAPGLGQGFSVGIVHGGPAGGHTAGTLSAVDHFGAVNVESGGGTGQGATYGGAAVGADHGQFTEQHHLAIGADGAFESAGGPSMAQQMALLRQKVQEILDKALDPIKEAMGAAIGTPPPEWLGIPPAALDETKTAAVDTAFDFIENLGDKLRSAYDLAKNVTSFLATTVTGLFRDNGGYIPTGQSVVTNETGKPEAVFNWKQVEQLRSILESVRDLDELWAILGDLNSLATTGKSTGVLTDPDLVDAILDLRESVLEGLDTLNTDMVKVLEDAGRKAATGYASEAADFFGFKGVYDAINQMTNRPAQGASATPAASGASATSATGGTSAGAVEVAGDPNVRFELAEIGLETQMPDLEASGTPGSGPIKDQVREAFAPYGWDSGPEWEAAEWIIGKESSWDPNAQNPTSTAYGLFQFLDSTWDTVGATKTDNPKLQAEAGAKYIKNRYGTPTKAKAFWEANGWYDRGGLAIGRGFMAKATLLPERVLSPSETEAFQDWLAAGSSDEMLDVLHGIPTRAEFDAMAERLSDDASEPRPVYGAGAPLVNIERLEARDEEEAMAAAAREARRVARSVGLVGGWS